MVWIPNKLLVLDTFNYTNKMIINSKRRIIKYWKALKHFYNLMVLNCLIQKIIL